MKLSAPSYYFNKFLAFRPHELASNHGQARAGTPALQSGLHLREDLAGEAFPDEFVAVGEEFFQREFAGVYFGE